MSTRGGRNTDARERPQRSMRVQTTRPATLRQRGVEATRAVREVLNLAPEVSDAHITTALAEVAAEESRRNPQFAGAVRERARELAQPSTSNARPARGAKPQPLPPLVPIRQISGYREIDPFKPPDPRFIVQVFGHHQLARALQDYSLSMLKETAVDTERTHPGTKPASRTRKADLIAYIVEHTPAE